MKETRFKDTEVGRIPENWDIILLGDIFEFKNGLNASKDCFGFGNPIINYTDVYRQEALGHSNIKGKVSLSKSDIKRFQVHKNDVFFTRTSETPEEVGYSSVLLEDIEDCVFSGFVLRARPKKQVLDSKYCIYCFSTKQVRNAIINSCTYTTRALTNGKVLSAIHIALPPIEEQRRIASALTSIDNLIDSLDRLIAKKRDIKQGAMQQLLSGKKRLKGFTEPWVEKKLGDVALFPTSNIKCNNFNSALFVTTDNMMPNKMGIVPFDGQISYANVREYKTDDILTSNIRPYLKKIWLANCNGGCSSDVIVLRANCDLILPRFLYMVVGNDTFFNYSMDNAIGTKMPRGNKKALKEYLFALPSLPEQQAIAAVLTSMDNELSALEAKRKKYEQIKQGMMQQLLTGRIRLENTSTLLSANTL